jgi:tripartite-type tricarboxylate transporter receptor subunit TctC
MTNGHLLLKLVLAAGLIAVSGPVRSNAQSYPQRFITLVAATAAGGPGDAAGRVIAERMSAILGQQIVVENVPGGGGITGASRVARADPDGYTLLIHQTGITIAPALYAKLPFSLEKDLTAVGLVNTSYMFLVGRKSLPVDTMGELAAWMKRLDTPARFAHPGSGSIGHLATVLVARSAGANIHAIPYRGIGPAMNDLIGEHVDLLWPGAVSAAPLINAAKVKAFAYGGPKRSALAPHVPSTGELGYPELDVPLWHALFAPAATPRPILEKLNAALRDALADARVIKAYQEAGVEAFPPDHLTIEAAQEFVRGEVDRWSKVVRDNNIQIEQ